MPAPRTAKRLDLESFLPDGLGDLSDTQKAVPRIAKTEQLTTAIERTLPQLPSTHNLHLGDARELDVPPESVHLVLTSPPYWTLKDYNRTDGQLGHVEDYERFLNE